MPFGQIHAAGIRAEHARLTAAGVNFRGEPKSMGPTLFVDFDDTCGNFIRLVQALGGPF